MASRRSPTRRHPFSGYVFPFMQYSTGRVDQGQDFTGQGPILAIGKAKILRTGAPGWPEGGGVLYKLLEGPYKGHNIFVYEGVDVPNYIKPGAIVNAGQPIATFRKGGSIETGFANEAGEPLSHAEYVASGDGTETRFGKQMKRFLDQLESHTAPAQLGRIQGAPSFLGQLGEQVTHPGQTAKEDLGAAGGLSDEIISGIVGDVASHSETLMLNIVLLFGGAFLVYYGVALMLGIHKPVAGPAKAAAAVAGAAA